MSIGVVDADTVDRAVPRATFGLKPRTVRIAGSVAGQSLVRGESPSPDMIPGEMCDCRFGRGTSTEERRPYRGIVAYFWDVLEV